MEADIRHKEANHSCGDSIEVSLRFNGDTIADYSFSGQGCAISMAAADMLGDRIIGISCEEAAKITNEDVYEMLGIEISLHRSKCALISLEAIRKGLQKASFYESEI